MSEDRYSYSHNEETYFGDYDTREEALRQADAGPGETVWTGHQVDVRIGDFAPFATDLLEQCRDRAAERAGWDLIEGWLNWVSAAAELALQERLKAVLEAWADEFAEQPTFFLIEDVQQHVMPEEAQA